MNRNPWGVLGWLIFAALFILVLQMLSLAEQVFGRTVLLWIKVGTLFVALLALFRGHLSHQEGNPPVPVLIALEIVGAYMLLNAARELLR